MRALFMLATLDGGGAERTVLTLLPHLHARGIDARVGLLARKGPFDRGLDASQVVVARGGNWITSGGQAPDLARIVVGVPLVPLQQLDLLRRFKPHVMVSCTAGMNLAALASTRLYGRRRAAWILREGNNTRAMLEDDVPGRLGRAIRSWATRTCYRAPDAILTVSRGVADGLVRDFRVPPALVRVIPNPVDISSVRGLADERASVPLPSPRVLVGCGRLTRQKGFDVLLHAFARIADPDLALVILGEGPERARLESLARDLGVSARVSLPGFVSNPWAVMARASAFVFPSRWEGFGSALVEALACGVPVVAADCPFGPGEILQDGVTGMLARADDADSLASVIRRLLADSGLRSRIAMAGRCRAMDFDVPVVVDRYAALLEEAAAAAVRT